MVTNNIKDIKDTPKPIWTPNKTERKTRNFKILVE